MSEERIRKVYVKDIKGGEALHTVFRATRKERHTSRAGKTYITMALVDRTGEIEARIFDNVDAADGAFKDDDYLLVQGKVGTFHGKAQLVVDTLERLDAGPIDAAEFAYVAPPPAPAPAPTPQASAPEEQRPAKKSDEVVRELRLPRRVQRLLEAPQVAQALDALLGYVERLVDEKVAARLGEKPERAEKPDRAERPDRPERKPRGPRVEHKAAPEAARHEKHEKHEPRRDPSLPEGLAFKPFSQLVSDEKPAEATTPPPATEG